MGPVKCQAFRKSAGAFLAALWTATFTTPLLATGEIRLSMDGGRVTVIATDVRLADVLAEWSRIGAMRFVGGEAIGEEAITMHVVDVTEEEAIRLLLRAAAGFVAAPRPPGASGASRYDRVTILARRGTSEPARLTATPPDQGATAAAPARAGGGRAPEQPALVSMEELQRLLDAAAANADDASSYVPAVITTPLPGVGADPSSSFQPARRRPDRR